MNVYVLLRTDSLSIASVYGVYGNSDSAMSAAWALMKDYGCGGTAVMQSRRVGIWSFKDSQYGSVLFQIQTHEVEDVLNQVVIE